MQGTLVTTPFGRRPMTLALVKDQLKTGTPNARTIADKWKVFRDVCEARDRLGLQDRTLAVLHALLSFYPQADLSGDRDLVVFPSNAQLSIRAHGIAGTTLRRHLGILVDVGLIQRRDSPNGKRYARRNKQGEIADAFGFSSSPLVTRAGELAKIAQEVSEENVAFKRAKEALTLCRRDVRKLISAAMEEGADGNWSAIETMYVELVERLPRAPRRDVVDAVLDEMRLLRSEILNLLENQLIVEKSDGNDIHDGCHIQNSKPESTNELEPSSGKEQARDVDQKPRAKVIGLKTYPLGMVLKACPQIADYTSGGKIEGWRDLMSAAVVVRSMLGVSPSAYQEACEVMEPENAAIAIACILERSEHINSPGGYLRDLTRKAARDEFGLGPMLMAALKANARPTRMSA
jgi:replication initiation protein RepC